MINEELVRIISADLKRGLKEEQIKQSLLSGNYSDYDIDKALKYLKTGKDPDLEEKKIEKKELPDSDSLKDWDKEIEKTE